MVSYRSTNHTCHLTEFTLACTGPGGSIPPDTFLQLTDRKPYAPSKFSVVTSENGLNCGFDHDNELCQWTDGGGALPWALAKFKQVLPQTEWDNIMGEPAMPQMWFLYAGTPRPRDAADFAELKATIPCQDGTGSLDIE